MYFPLLIWKDLQCSHICSISKPQVRVAAYDTVHPNSKSYDDLTVQVQRNPNRPTFNRNSYSTRITDSFPAGEEIPLDIEATDDDNVRIDFSLFHIVWLSNPSLCSLRIPQKQIEYLPYRHLFQM